MVFVEVPCLPACLLRLWLHSQKANSAPVAQVARHEQVKVVLHGQSEFEASHVVLLGSHTFEVRPAPNYLAFPYKEPHCWTSSRPPAFQEQHVVSGL